MIKLTAFYTTPLGHLHKAIPFDAFIKGIKAPLNAISGKGCKPRFDVKGGISLQILKSCYRCSDALLIEQLNGNWQMQLFCGIQLKHGEQIKDKDIVGRWRSFLGKKLDMDKLQLGCVQHWRPSLQDTNAGFCDATVYESYIAYPTDAKLLWQACCDVYKMIKNQRKTLKLRHTRSNHEKRKAHYLSFVKRRKKSIRQSKKICRGLLKYLVRLLEQLQKLVKKYKTTTGNHKRFTTIEKLKEQQWKLHFGNELTVTDRIVSLHKDYVRPIIRGKEVKPV